MSALHCRVIQTPMSWSQDCPAVAARLVMFEPFQPACILPILAKNPYEQPGGERKSIRFIRMRCRLPRRCQIGTRNTHNPIRQSPRQCRVTALDAGFENEVGFRMLPASCRVIYSLLVATSLAGGLTGCASIRDLSAAADGSPRAITAATPAAPPATAEQQLLFELGRAGPGESISLMGGTSAVADSVYPAASGRQCRWVTLRYPGGDAGRRLACVSDGNWQWSAAVLADHHR